LPISAWAEATHHKSAKPIVDKQGRTRVIVDFTDEAYLAYPRDLLINFDPKKDIQQPQALALIKEYEQRYGFVREGLTTWVGASVTAYLTANQIERLKADRNIKLLTDDEHQQFSAPASPPPWYASWTGGIAWGELNDWGRAAVNGKTVLPGSYRKVYIIDSGVAYHNDLSSVSQRVNVNCGTGGDCSGLSVSWPGVGYYSKVGCYAHSTHIAGIVGASANGTAPRAGVYAGVNMVSIALGGSQGVYNNAWIACADGGLNDYLQNGVYVSNIGFAFDFIAAQNQPNGPIPGTANVASISINPGGLGFGASGVAETNRSKLLAMVNPANPWRYFQGQWVQWYYPGIFVAQSAGNQNRNACSQRVDGRSAAFQTTPSPTGTAIEGIMVVGALRQNGTPASTSVNPVPPTFNLTSPEPRIFGTAPTEPGSNYGNCVDIWAPGDFIYSTWGSGVNATYATGSYSGGQPSTYTPGLAPGNPTSPYSGAPSTGFYGWQWLSGTSMAAPHVAAAAAYVADKYNLVTPAAIEQQLRSDSKYWGATDPLGFQARIVYLPD
jgi:hypothetical protein